MDGAVLAGYPAYDSYRDSGVEWIGAVPSTWRVERGKWLFVKKDRPVRPNDEIVTCFRDGQVTLRNNRRTEGFTNALKEHGYQGIRKGDLVIHAMDAFAGAIGVSDSDGKATPVYSACVPRGPDTVDPYFYAYYMRHVALSGLLVSLAKGIRERSTDFRYNDFAELQLAVPPLPEQRAISGFLDEKCARLDEAVRIKQAQIALLRERRQILIQQAVTTGLNPAVPMKNSGIDWIGQVPAHWEVKRFTKEVYVQEGPGIMAVDFREDGVPLIRISGVRTKTVTLEGCNYLDPAKARRKWNHFLLEEGDLVISGSASTGLVAEVGPEASGAVLYTGLMKLRIKNAESLLKPYFQHFLGSQAFDIQVELLKAGSTIAHYGPSHLGKMFIVIPPLREQEEVAAYCDHENKRFDSAIAIKESQIAALREYRISLINAAVTGKIKVA